MPHLIAVASLASLYDLFLFIPALACFLVSLGASQSEEGSSAALILFIAAIVLAYLGVRV